MVTTEINLKKANVKISNLNKEVKQFETQIEWFKEVEEKYIDNKGKLDKLYNDNYNDIISEGELKSFFYTIDFICAILIVFIAWFNPMLLLPLKSQ